MAQVTSKKFNVLYFSFCSVDTNFLPYYSSLDSKKLKNELPNITKIFDQSVIFTNSYTDYSWSTARRYTYLDAWRKKYAFNNKWHEPIQDWEQNSVNATLIRVPYREDFINQYNDFYTDERLIDPFEKLDEIFQLINDRKKKKPSPNFWMMHFKLMHYPYLSQTYLNNKILLEKIFTSNEIKLINLYSKNPTQYPDKYPFFQILFGEPKFKKIFLDKQGRYISYLTNESAVANWKKSKNYQDDLNILIKSYQFRLRDMDRLVGELFKRYQKIEDDTVLILGGDHGETVVGRNYLSHGFVPYDEVIKFFHAVHFPKQSVKITIKTQVSQASLGSMIEKITQGGVDQENFVKKPTVTVGDEVVYSFSCAGDVVSVRDPLGWKYILYLNDQREYLFNIIKDTQERVNLAAKYPDLAFKYKTEITNQLAFRQFFKDACLK